MKVNIHIQNPGHYFNKYISCEIKNDNKKMGKIRQNECSLDEKLEEGQIPINLICNFYGELFENPFSSQEILMWLENIENERLYLALRELKVSQLNLIYLHLIKGYTQREISAEIKINQKTVSTNIKRAVKKLKKLL